MRRVWRVKLKTGVVRMVNDWPISFECAIGMARIRYGKDYINLF